MSKNVSWVGAVALQCPDPLRLDENFTHPAKVEEDDMNRRHLSVTVSAGRQRSFLLVSRLPAASASRKVLCAQVLAYGAVGPHSFLSGTALLVLRRM